MGKFKLLPKHKLFVYLFIFFFLAFGSEQLLGWPLVRIWGASPWGYGISGDLQSVLSSADCFKQAPIGLYTEGDVGYCPYIYGYTLVLALNFFGLGVSSTVFLSWVFVAGMAATLAYLTYLAFALISDLWVRIALVVAMISPPVALLLERANFDVVVFLLSIFGLVLVKQRRYFSAAFVIGGAALMKFYALLGFLIFASARMKLWQKIVVSVIVLAVLVEIAAEVFVRRPAVPMDIGGAFGSYSIGLWFNFSTEYLRIPLVLSNTASLAIGLLALLVGILCTFMFLKKIKALGTITFDLRQPSRLENFGSGMAPVFLGCYVLGTNYDYRLIFLVPFALALIARSDEKKTRSIFLGLFLAAMWLSYNSGIFGQVAGDIVMGLWASVAAISITMSAAGLLPSTFQTRLHLFVENSRKKNVSDPNR